MNRKNVIKARLAALEKELIDLEQLGDDIYADGDVLKIEKKFTDDETATVYTYAALKIIGKWYLTGACQYGISWNRLVENLCGNGAVIVSYTKLVSPSITSSRPVKRSIQEPEPEPEQVM